jgi:tripartite-type tricarboxylate transporter receptor subunit TctC
VARGKKFTNLMLFALVSGLAPAMSHAQTPFPAKPVKIVVGFPAGSSADLTARILAKKLGENLGQPFIVENRPGAGSSIATEFVVRAPGDGYTLLMGTVANTINATLAKSLSFNFSQDLAPIAPVGTVPNILVVHASLGVTTVKDLIALAKSRPGQILYGSSGNGTSPHLSGELFNSMAGVKLVHVPYKGSSQAVTDLLAGRVQVMFSPASTVLPHIQAGTLKALASTGVRRAGVAPDIPTISESGLSGFDTAVWFGLLAPSGTARDIISRLAAAVGQALGSADVKAQLSAQGIDLLGGGPEEFARYIREETEKWARVIQVSGAKID